MAMYHFHILHFAIKNISGLVLIESICRQEVKGCLNGMICPLLGTKHCGRKNFWLPAFSPFPHVFWKDSLQRLLKAVMFNSLPNWIYNFILVQIKAFADDKINVIHKLKIVFERVENIVEKGENAGYQPSIFSFSQCFQNPSFSGSIKVGIVVKS